MDLKQNIRLEPGKYVLAVSGGVDSVVLLDILAGQSGVEIVVAHLDHGIRSDSAEDEKFVAGLAKKYGFEYESETVSLGQGASEDMARQASYKFLKNVAKRHKAKAIVTAHHQDDFIETAAINLIRGSGRRGLSSLSNTSELRRPLLKVPKSEILKYAQVHDLKLREDSTNAQTKYLRNKLRHNVIAKTDEQWRQKFLDHLSNAERNNEQLDHEVEQVLSWRLARNRGALSRLWLTHLSHALASEIIYAWLRKQQVKDINQAMVERLVVASKVGRQGSKVEADKNNFVQITKRSLRMHSR